MSKWASVKVRSEVLLQLKSVKTRFNFGSLNEIIEVFLAIRTKKGWDLSDMYTMSKWGTLPEVVVVQGGSDEECRAKLGLDNPKARKTGEIPNIEKIGELSTVMLKGEKKPDS